MSTGRGLRGVLADRRFTLSLRWAVGALLIWASHDRLLDPQPLALAVDDYRIVPLAAVNLIAVVLPWVELATGLCLITGLGAQGAGLLTAGLAVLYTGAVGSALVRGLEIGCGCFGDAGGTLAWTDLWLRAALLAAGLQIALAAGAVDWPLAVVMSRMRRSRRAGGASVSR